MTRYSFVQLLRNALGFGDGWQQAWRSPEPKPSYDVVIVGAGKIGAALAQFRGIVILLRGQRGVFVFADDVLLFLALLDLLLLLELRVHYFYCLLY